MKHVARKRFGQHFLVDDAIILEIVRAIAVRAGDTLVEIGPGLGALTRPLLRAAGRLAAIELDRDLAARLQGTPGLQVIEADVLAVDFVQLADRLGATRLRLCGNLPYNISSPILFHLLPVAERVQDQHFMLQKEVAERMVAPAGSSAYGRLSVMLQWRYSLELLLLVPPQAFAPPPRVQSAVVRMVPRACPDRVDAGLLSQVVRVAFSQRRKLLRHALGPWLEQRQFPGTFDLKRRAQEVTVSEYAALARALAQAHAGRASDVS